MRDFFGNSVYGFSFEITRPSGMKNPVQYWMGQIDGISSLLGFYPDLDCGGFVGHNYEHSGNPEKILSFLKEYFSGKYSPEIHGALMVSWVVGQDEKSLNGFMEEMGKRLD